MAKKLLLADDSITIQKVIGIIFATEDYQLLVCDDGNEAFDKAMSELPDLVIADISMPGRDGFELCQAINLSLAWRTLRCFYCREPSIALTRAAQSRSGLTAG